MSIFKKKKKKVEIKPTETVILNRKSRRRQEAFERSSASRKKKAIQEKAWNLQKKAIADRVKRQQDRAHKRALERKALKESNKK